MAELVKYIYGTEAQILALTPESPNWIDKAFYYPSDKNYFYQAWDGVMRKFGDVSGTLTGTGVTLNGNILGGVKTLIESSDVLDIPANYNYNTLTLEVDGIINNNGQINFL